MTKFVEEAKFLLLSLNFQRCFRLCPVFLASAIGLSHNLILVVLSTSCFSAAYGTLFNLDFDLKFAKWFFKILVLNNQVNNPFFSFCTKVGEQRNRREIVMVLSNCI